MNWTMQDDYLNWNGIISNEDEKINIAKKVAEKVKDGEVIGFGSGSTSFLTIKEIAKKINKDISEVNSMLTIMEIEGTIEQVPGNYYVRAGKKIS